MSFKSREKRRKRLARENYRKQNWNPDPSSYYLTFAKKQSKCFHCQGEVQKRDEIAFRYQPLEVWHKRCADLNGLASRESRRWRKAAA
jgi:hypothetical protein